MLIAGSIGFISMNRAWFCGVLLVAVYGGAYDEISYPELSKRLCLEKPQPVSTLYVVGDSTVDTGNFYQYSRFLAGRGDIAEPLQALYPWVGRNIPGFIYGSACGVVPGAHYHGGRFCDDLMATELVAQSLNLNISNKTEFVDMSHGGSSVVNFYEVLMDFIGAYLYNESKLANFSFIGSQITGGKPLMNSVEDQVDHLIQTHSPFSGQQIIMVAGGANDYLNKYWNYQRVVSKLVASIDKLYDHGFRTIIWGTLPDVTKTPCLRHAENRQAIREAVFGHNRLAIQEYYRLRKRYPDLLLLFFDNNRMFELMLDESREKGIDTDTPCLDVTFKGCSDTAKVDICDSHKASVCTNAAKHFYHDSCHSSGMVQSWIFNFSCQMLFILNYKVNCPVPDRQMVDTLLLRYFTEKPGYLEREYVKLILQGQCPAQP